MLGSGSTITGNIEGGDNTTAVFGDNTTLAGNIGGMGQIFVGGNDVAGDGNIDDILANEVVVGPGASIRVIGNLETATLIIVEAGSLVVEGTISTVERLDMRPYASLVNQHFFVYRLGCKIPLTNKT